MNAKTENRKHDGFFKYIYTVPKNAQAMLNTFSRHSGDVLKMLSNVDLSTLEEIPERYHNVDEYGEADIAFRAKTVSGESFYFGILLEHKSEHKGNVLEQTFRYAFNVLVDKSNTTFKWLPTKAIIIYNGTDNWNPLDDFRNTPHGDFAGSELPFECAFVDLKYVDDNLIVESETPETAVGLLAMKYCHDMDAFSRSLDAIEPLLRKMPNEDGTTLVRKIELYLGEYLTNEAREKLNMAIKSLGERLGYVSIGDIRRARERKIRIESEKRGEAIGFEKAEKVHLQNAMQSAREMLRDGIPLEKVVRYQKLTEEQVKMLI